MKVVDLIAFLNTVDPDNEIVLSSDSEGNNFSPLADASIGIYEADTSCSGYIFDVSWTAEDAGLEQDQWQDILDSNKRSVVLWPTN